MSQEIEIGLGKKGRLGYALDDVAIVPSRRTRDPEDVSTSWQIDAYEFDVPVIGAPMDSVTSPATAIAMGKMGALGVLDLEGLWTRYEDPTPLLDEIAGLPADQATERIQQIYAEPVKPELITQRLHEIRAAGVTVAGALSPQRTQQFYSTVVDAGVDLFVIRGTVVSAEHVSSGQEPLNLKKFIYDLDVPVIVGGASNYTAALHLMRTGAAGVLVGFGGFVAVPAVGALVGFGRFVAVPVVGALVGFGGFVAVPVVGALVGFGGFVASPAVGMLVGFGGFVASPAVGALVGFGGFVAGFAVAGASVTGVFVAVTSSRGMSVVSASVTEGVDAAGVSAAVASAVGVSVVGASVAGVSVGIIVAVTTGGAAVCCDSICR